MSLVDSHCHLDDEQFNGDRDAVIHRALEAGVSRMLSIGTGAGPPDLEAAVRLAERHAELLATVGIHPQYASKTGENDYKHLADLVRHPKVVALGEIGLDYHWEPYDANVQAAVFIEQMNIARDARKPIVIHTRDAWSDTMALLGQHWASTQVPCVMHCFTGGPAEAQQALDLGFYISFAGVVTYPKAASVQDAAKIVPLDRLLIETDAPYLAPIPNRGKRNEPAFVAYTAAKLAELKRLPLADIVSATSDNFARLVSYTEGFE